MSYLTELDARHKEKAAAEKERIAAETARLQAKTEAKRQADKAAKEEREREAEAARQVAAAERFDRERKEPARRAWLASGGTEDEFTKAWPSLRQELLKEATRERMEAARAATFEHARANF